MSAAPKSYTEKFTVYRHDGDHLGNVKPGALLRYAQQIATTHAEAAGLTDEVYTATRTAFVLAKLALHIDRTPRVDEELTLVTQPECCKRAVNKRITHFTMPTGPRSPLLTVAGCSSTLTSASFCANTLSSLPTIGPRMCPLHCR